MSERTEKLLAEIEAYIAENRRLLEEEKEVELGGMEQLAASLIEQASKIAPDERARYARQISDTMKELSALDKELRARQNQIVKQTREVATHHKANVAYRTAEASDQHHTKKEE